MEGGLCKLMSMSTTNAVQTTPEREAQLDKYTEGFMSGRAFANVSASVRSIGGYQPPTTSTAYAQALAILAQYARLGDRQAKLVAAVVSRLPLHSTGGQSVAAMFDAAREELARGYFDTVGNAGPEAGRRSDHEHEYTLRDRLVTFHALKQAAGRFIPGEDRHGWAFEALMERERVYAPEPRW